jgi:hypothetical protein
MSRDLRRLIIGGLIRNMRVDGHVDSSNRLARVKTSGLHGATALLAVLPKLGDSSQEDTAYREQDVERIGGGWRGRMESSDRGAAFGFELA